VRSARWTNGSRGDEQVPALCMTCLDRFTRCAIAAVTLSVLVCLAVPARPATARQAAPAAPPAISPEAPELQYAVVNGVRLAFRVSGNGVPVVFVHGESHSHEVWREQIDAIGARYTAIVYDRRGHGQSDAPFTGYSPIAHLHDLQALLRFLGVQDAHFVVSSRGGAIVLQLLRVEPRVVRSVVFADATIPIVPLSPAFEAAVQRYRRPASSLDEAARERAARKQAPFYRVARTLPRVADVMSRMIDQHSLRIAMNPRRGADLTSPMDIGPWNAIDFPDMVALAKPVLIVVGAETDPLFLTAAEQAVAAWPTARRVVVPGADHLLPLEAPRTFNTLLTEFFNAVDAGRTHAR
jgi:pimeloyl-ACP methyl ester carboxylesterase